MPNKQTKILVFRVKIVVICLLCFLCTGIMLWKIRLNPSIKGLHLYVIKNSTALTLISPGLTSRGSFSDCSIWTRHCSNCEGCKRQIRKETYKWILKVYIYCKLQHMRNTNHGWGTLRWYILYLIIFPIKSVLKSCHYYLTCVFLPDWWFPHYLQPSPPSQQAAWHLNGLKHTTVNPFKTNQQLI